MTAVTIPHSRSDSKMIVKAAFENCSGIKTYHDDGIRVIGKTGASMGLMTSSYGEKIIVEIPEDQTSSSETMVTVSGQKEVATNIGADPEKHASHVIKSINTLKKKKIAEVVEILNSNGVDKNSKEVAREQDQAGGSEFMIVIVFLILFFVFIMPIMMI